MAEAFLTQEMLQRIAKMPKHKRPGAMKIVAQEEWQRCADDVFYWLDASKHLVPYVYTKDPKAAYTCNLCNTPSITYNFDKRAFHLLNTHSIDIPTEVGLKEYFTQLPTIRPLPMHDYFHPIIEVWLRNPLVAVQKSRDMMQTWLIVCLYTWDSLFHEGKQNMFQSENATKTRELIERSNTIYSNQPKWLKDVHKAHLSEGTNRSGLIRIPTLQSEIIGMPQGADKLRMYHPSGIFSDEAAFNPDASNTFAAIKPAINAGGRYTAISSANPSWFWRICTDTLEGEA